MFLNFLVLLQLWVITCFGLIEQNIPSDFVSVSGDNFRLDGETFRFYGTNVYWMHMATDDDMDFTFRNIATAGFSVVRIWAFNDVTCKPASGTYFQILRRNETVINDGPDGLQRLDKAIATADKYGIKLLLTLTNNWNPERPVSESCQTSPDGFSRGYLSNDYGGMDLYVRTLRPGGTHDLFYTDRAIIGAFKNYLAHVVPRYAAHPAVLGWELGNDLRCSSTLAASLGCNTKTITKWVAEIAKYVKQLNPFHLVTAGDGGFYCLHCSKIFSRSPPQLNHPSSGHSFDGSYGVDTEDILAVPNIDFGSFQFFPDQIEYFPAANRDPFTRIVTDGGGWIGAHSYTATLAGKPEVLTAVGLVTRQYSSLFVPINSSAPNPDGPCIGVESSEADYGFIFWTAAATSGNIGGMLEYHWVQDGLNDDPFDNTAGDKIRVTVKGGSSSPNTGPGRYGNDASTKNAKNMGGPSI